MGQEQRSALSTARNAAVRAQGETREPKKDMVYVDAEGHQRHVKDAGAQLVERQRAGAAVGKAMRVVAGTHAGLLCTVLEIEPKARPHAIPHPMPSGDLSGSMLLALLHPPCQRPSSMNVLCCCERIQWQAIPLLQAPFL